MGVKPEDYATLAEVDLQAHQHPRRAGDDAAQGRDGRAGRRGHAHRPDRRRLQRDPAAPRRQPARRSVRRRRLRPRHRAQGPDARRARACWCRATAASAARSRRRWRRPASPTWRSTTATPRRRRRSRERLRQHYPALDGRDRLERSGRLRSGRQCDAARHEGRRPVAVRRRRASRRAPSSARW